MTSSGIKDRAKFDHIRYANLWEDADILCEAFKPLGENKSFLSIASAGDNALALLILNPKIVVAVDLNVTQLACLALRIEAIRQLDHEELLAFLGVLPAKNRSNTFARLSKNLKEPFLQFWLQNPELIEQGVIHAGKFDRFLKTFGCKLVPMIHSQERIERMLQEKSEYERRKFYEKEWDSIFWRLIFKIFASKPVMGRFGRDPAFLKHVIGSPGERLLERTRYAMTTLSTHDNPYLSYVFRGNFTPDCLPHYLRKENLERIKNNLDRIHLFKGYAHEAPHGPFDALNLSDIFEYMNKDEFLECYGRLLGLSNKHARLAYWNMLVDRKPPLSYHPQAKRLDDDSDRLFRKDKAWFYQAFHIDEVQ